MWVIRIGHDVRGQGQLPSAEPARLHPDLQLLPEGWQTHPGLRQLPLAVVVGAVIVEISRLAEQ